MAFGSTTLRGLDPTEPEELREPTGLGDFNDNVSDIATDLMAKDSPLMRQAATEGMQFANSRGLLNSTLAGQASQAAVLRHVVPMASQTASQGFQRGQQERQFAFQGGESALQRGFLGEESRLQRGFLGEESALQRGFLGGEAALDRDQKTEQFDVDAEIRREALSLEASLSEAENALKKTIADLQLTSNDRRGAESVLSNAFRDFEEAQRSILSNTDLGADDRNKLLRNARDMLTAKIDYTTALYSANFDWPDNPFTVNASSDSGTSPTPTPTSTPEGTSSSQTSTTSPTSTTGEAPRTFIRDGK